MATKFQFSFLSIIDSKILWGYLIRVECIYDSESNEDKVIETIATYL